MAPAPTDENRITYFAETDARGKRMKFGIKAKDRTRHVYVIGKTGMGKSTLLENMAVQDIQGGEGMCFIDPHGKTADLLLEYVPKERIRDVIVIAPFDLENPISFNVLESVDPAKRHLVVGGLMSTFKKIWEDAWSARMEYILTNTLLALLEAPNSTLLGVNRMLSDKAYRNEIVSHVTDPSVKSFWVKEFANYTERMAAEAVPAIQNKVGQFTANPLIRNMIGQPQSSFDFRKAMDERKIIIINLSKGRIGDENMKLLGGLLVTKIYLAAMSRADVPDRVMKMLPNFYLHVDEFQNFANASFADILSEARKYKLNLTIAHQYIEQMDEIVRPAVFGNVGTMIAFRVGATDAEIFEKEFAPVFVLEDLVNLGFTQIYLKLMIDGLSSAPFSATTLPPIPHPDTSYVEEIIAASREQFSRPRAEVEVEIVKFHEAVSAKKQEVRPEGRSDGAGAQRGGPTEVTKEQGGTPAIPATKPVPTFMVKSAPSAVQKSVPTVIPKSVSGSVTAVTPLKTTSIPAALSSKSSAPRPALEGHSSMKDALNSAISKPKPAESAAPIVSNVPITPVTNVSAPMVDIKSAGNVKPTVPSQVKQTVSGISKPQAVSLSSLAPKPSVQRQDPKIPSKENINGLKNALAAALSKAKTTDSSQSQVKNDSVRADAKPPMNNDGVSATLTSLKDLKPVPKITSVQPVVQTNTAHTTPQQVPSQAPQEVPEDVLKDVLKVE